MTPLPVTIVSGYLGAGKTTLVNRILAEPLGARLVVLVNDFGDIAIDQALIENADGDTIALANGCMCCSIGDDLYRALDRVLGARPRADRLLIETSGVADPGKIAAIARAEPELRLDGCVVLVDAVNFARGLAAPYLADTLRRQVASADLVVLTKTDVVEPDVMKAVSRTIEHLAPHTPWLRSNGDAVVLRLLGDLAQDRTGNMPHRHDHGGEYASWVWQGNHNVDLGGLRNLLAEEAEPFRLKGFVKADGVTYELHRAGDTMNIHRTTAAHEPVVIGIGPAARFDAARFGRKWETLLDACPARSIPVV